MINLEKLKKKIKKIYRNYGINVSEVTEEEILRVCNHYLLNPDKLEQDYQDSLKHANLYTDEEVV